MMHQLKVLALLVCSLNNVAAIPFSTTNFQGQFTDDSGVLRELSPTSSPDFSFSPTDVFEQRNGNGNYHTGDLNIYYRLDGNTGSSWINASTATDRNITLESLPTADSVLLASDLTPILQDPFLNITRKWIDHDGDLVLSFNISNINSNSSIEIGALGFPIEFNNVFTDRHAEDAVQICSFVDPYIGLDAGYVQVTRLTGTGPNLVLTPFTNITKLEAWEFLVEEDGEPSYQSNAYEGNFAWQVYSQALADTEWGSANPWNTPSSQMLKPGESLSYGLRFTLAPTVFDIEDTVSNFDNPIAVGLPGYILTTKTVGHLFLNSSSEVENILLDPEGALVFEKASQTPSAPWKGYSVTPANSSFGRVRVTITYDNGIQQALHYWISDDRPTSLDKIGQHMATHQWYTNTSDPFFRAPSIISWDKATNDIVLQDYRTWIAGLSDEGGAGSFVVFAMKQIYRPVQEEVDLLEQFINQTVWGHLQDSSGNTTYGVKRMLFFYEPDKVPGYNYDPSIPWQDYLTKEYAYAVDRAYNYVWVSTLYWALYKANRVSPGILTLREPQWYLNQAYATVKFGLNADVVGYTDAGLMGESIWGHLISDLRAENLTTEANTLETRMQERQQYWSQQADPYGSEQPWDCTGQEGVYFWSQYFNDTATAAKTIDSIHSFDPTVPHWGYNGNARRYWDFRTAGSMPLARIERQIHHYGSPLNAIPLLDWYRRSDAPSALDSIYNLRVGFAGHMASYSNVDQEGFGSMSFHSYPWTLEWDSYTGDYGPSFVGQYQTSASYLVQHPDFGWIAFGGNVEVEADGTISVTPLDTARRRAFVAPVGLFVEFEAGQIETFTWDEKSGRLSLDVGRDIGDRPEVVMTFEQTSSVVAPGQVVLTTTDLEQHRGGYVVQIPEGGVATVSWHVESV